MNRPGQPSGNWGWRVTAKELDQADFGRLRELTETYERC
jgi:4-alpha-glucanotransferase